MASPFCERVARNVLEHYRAFAAPGQIVDGLGRVFGQPLTRLRGITKNVDRTLGVVYHAAAANEAYVGRSIQLLRDLKVAGLAGIARDPEMVRGVWRVLDTVPSRVLVGMGERGATWNTDEILRRSYAELKRINELGGLKSIYDPRYIDPERLKAIEPEIRQTLDRTTPMQRQVMRQYAKFKRDERLMTISAKRATLGTELLEARRTDPGALAPFSDELRGVMSKRNKLLRDQTGHTVTSYITHFTADQAQGEANLMDFARLGRLTSYEDLADEIRDIVTNVPATPQLRADLGTEDRAVYVAKRLADFMFPDVDEATKARYVKDLRQPAIRILQDYLGENAHRHMSAIIRSFPRRVFVPFLHSRLMKEMAEIPRSPFDDVFAHASLSGRSIFIEPAVAFGRAHRAELKAHPGKQREFDNWLTSMLGVPEYAGLRYVLGGTPGIRSGIRAAESLAVKAAYYKALWANTSSTLINLTQMLQFGTGRSFSPQELRLNAISYANGLRMLMDKSDVEGMSWFLNRLHEMNVAEHTFAGALGGAVQENVTKRGLAGSVPGQMWAHARQMFRDATTAEETVQAIVRGGGTAFHTTLEFMGMAERVLRTKQGAAEMYRSGATQLLERLPGARLIRDGEGAYIVGTWKGQQVKVDVLDALRESYARRYGRASRTGAKGELPLGHVTPQLPPDAPVVDWDRVIDDVHLAVADVNFVFSGANYSPFQRFVRGIPIVGPVSSVFMNYTMSVANRIGGDVAKLAKYTGQAVGLRPRLPVAGTEAHRALYRLTRYAVGTMMIGGPYAFRPVIAAALKAGHAMDDDIPESVDDPRVRGVLDAIESYSVAGVFGVDLSNRVGFDTRGLWEFVTGARFGNNPVTRAARETYTALGGGTATPGERAAARYALLGSAAGAVDPTREYGHNPLGRDNPLIPTFLHNLVQMSTDLYDNEKLGYTVDELGRTRDVNVPWQELAKRGLFGRSITDREKTRAISETRPRLNAQLADLRQRFVDATMRDDDEAMAAINDRYREIVPSNVGGVHPDLRMTRNDRNRWALRHGTGAEIRQLMFMQRGAARVELHRALEFMRRGGYVTADGKPDVDAIMKDADPAMMRALALFQAVLFRQSGRMAYADELGSSL